MKFSPKVVTTLLLLVGTTSPVLGSLEKDALRKDRSLLQATGDSEAPVLQCADATLELGGTEVGVTRQDVVTSVSDNMSMEADLMFSFGDSQTTFDCSNIDNPVEVTLTVTDEAGNSASCNADVSTQDVDAPTAQCKDAVVELDSAGEGSITPEDINDSSSDNCDDDLDLSLDTMDFGCSDIGPNMVTLTVTDDADNDDTCTGTVDVQDNTAPSFTGCRDSSNPLTVKLMGVNDEAMISAAEIGVADDNCSVDTVEVGGSDFTGKTYGCDDVGTDEFDVVATDTSGNTATCSVVVNVSEDEPPVAECVTTTIMKELNTATASLTVAEVDDGSDDNCDIAEMTLSKDSFTCADLGTNTVTMTVEDTSGNTASCDVDVEVLDVTPPDVDCRDIEFSLDSAGMLTIEPEDILADDDPADDNCGVPTSTVSQTAFSCSDIGSPIELTLTAVDNSGNSDSCTSMVTIVDDTPPEFTCPAQTIELDSTGAGSVDTSLYTATDNCDTNVGISIVGATSFSCADVGSSSLTVTFTDDYANESTCSPAIDVVDSMVPTITCPSGISVTASSQGFLSVPLTTVTASDNCGTPELTTPDLLYDCDNAEATRSITVTAEDSSGNTASCDTIVTITASPPLQCDDDDDCGFFCLILSLLTCGIV